MDFEYRKKELVSSGQVIGQPTHCLLGLTATESRLFYYVTNSPMGI